jgi:hypothetical protein
VLSGAKRGDTSCAFAREPLPGVRSASRPRLALLSALSTTKRRRSGTLSSETAPASAARRRPFRELQIGGWRN